MLVELQRVEVVQVWKYHYFLPVVQMCARALTAVDVRGCINKLCQPSQSSIRVMLVQEPRYLVLEGAQRWSFRKLPWCIKRVQDCT